MMKPLLRSTLLALLCNGAYAQKVEGVERKQLFDDNWQFALGNQVPAGAKGWRTLDLPHDWSIEGKIDSLNPSGNDGGYFPAGNGWYQKTFRAPAGWQGRRVSIYFEGVYMNSEVFLNGKSLGIHPYGYTSFSYDLTPYLDDKKENVISVRVDNSAQKNSRWYSGSGIYRHVWLVVTNPVHVGQWGVAITTPNVDKEKATVQIKTVVKNETPSPQSISVSAQLAGGKGKSAGQIKVEIPANSEKEVTQTIAVEHPLLWTPQTPHLYQAQISVLQGGRPLDQYQTSFGIRSIGYDTLNGFQLNGKTVKLDGGCAHHDNGLLGAAAYDRAEERKVQLLKAAGFNAVRTSHNPPSEAFLNACDRLGLMVIDEAFDGWRESKTPHDYSAYFDRWWQRDIDAMVLRDRNHPSIVMWSIGNEIIERKKAEAVETAKMLAGEVRKLDPTRPVTSAMTTWDRDWEIFDPLFAAHDIGGYNYQLHRAPSDHARVPSRVIVQTESYPNDAFANWKLVQAHNYIIGDFVWTALDYLGESSIGRYYYSGEPAGQHWEKNFFPWHGAYCGDIDLTGWRKPVSHYRNLLWNNTEKLYLAVREPNPDNGPIKLTSWAVWPTWESWTWPGREGKDMQVEVYSRYPSVRLYLNNRLVGEKATGRGQEFKATFTLPYEAGTLRAVGVEGNKELESTKLKTAGQAAQIKLVADRTGILANGQDLSFIMVEITDQEGNIQPNAEELLTFKVKGPALIAGLDNGNLKDPAPYVNNERKAWKGRALVVLKSTHNPGDVWLEVSAAGLPVATKRIRSSKP